MKRFLCACICAVVSVVAFGFAACADENVTSDDFQKQESQTVEYTIYYEIGGDGAEISANTQTVTYNEAFTLLTPTRNGYTFIEWRKTGTEERFESGVYTLETDVYLTAVWDVDIESDRWYTPDF